MVLEKAEEKKLGRTSLMLRVPVLPTRGIVLIPFPPDLGMGTAECLFGICIHLKEFTLPITLKEVKIPK